MSRKFSAHLRGVFFKQRIVTKIFDFFLRHVCGGSQTPRRRAGQHGLKISFPRFFFRAIGGEGPEVRGRIGARPVQQLPARSPHGPSSSRGRKEFPFTSKSCSLRHQSATLCVHIIVAVVCRPSHLRHLVKSLNTHGRSHSFIDWKPDRVCAYLMHNLFFCFNIAFSDWWLAKGQHVRGRGRDPHVCHPGDICLKSKSLRLPAYVHLHETF